jgi:hypothetical protein
MVYNFDKMAYKILENCKIDEVVSTAEIHEKLVRTAGFTGQRTRANFIRNLEKCEYIKDVGFGIWKIIKLPKKIISYNEPIDEKYL